MLETLISYTNNCYFILFDKFPPTTNAFLSIDFSDRFFCEHSPTMILCNILHPWVARRQYCTSCLKWFIKCNAACTTAEIRNGTFFGHSYAAFKNENMKIFGQKNLSEIRFILIAFRLYRILYRIIAVLTRWPDGELCTAFNRIHTHENCSALFFTFFSVSFCTWSN